MFVVKVRKNKIKKTRSAVYTHCFVLKQADVVGVAHIQKAAPPFLALFQILKQTSREDGLVLQRVLWWEQTHFKWMQIKIILLDEGMSKQTMNGV